MKYFLIVLLWLIPFVSPAQDVVIPSDVARYYLEQDDRVKILTSKDSINRNLINALNAELIVNQQVIITYKNDSSTMKTIITVKDQEMFALQKELITTQKSLETRKIEIALSRGCVIGILVGSAIPVVGTAGGFIIGGVAGLTTYAVRNFKKLFKY